MDGLKISRIIESLFPFNYSVCGEEILSSLSTYNKYLDFKVHSKRNLAFENFRRQEGHDVMQARIFWMGQLTCSNVRMQGCIVGGPTSH